MLSLQSHTGGYSVNSGKKAFVDYYVPGVRWRERCPFGCHIAGTNAQLDLAVGQYVGGYSIRDGGPRRRAICGQDGRDHKGRDRRRGWCPDHAIGSDVTGHDIYAAERELNAAEREIYAVERELYAAGHYGDRTREHCAFERCRRLPVEKRYTQVWHYCRQPA